MWLGPTARLISMPPRPPASSALSAPGKMRPVKPSPRASKAASGSMAARLPCSFCSTAAPAAFTSGAGGGGGMAGGPPARPAPPRPRPAPPPRAAGGVGGVADRAVFGPCMAPCRTGGLSTAGWMTTALSGMNCSNGADISKATARWITVACCLGGRRRQAGNRRAAHGEDNQRQGEARHRGLREIAILPAQVPAKLHYSRADRSGAGLAEGSGIDVVTSGGEYRVIHEVQECPCSMWAVKNWGP